MLFPDMNFISTKSLKPIEEVIREASEGLSHKTRVIANSKMSTVLAAACEAENKEGITFRDIYAFGTGKTKKLGEYIAPDYAGNKFINAYGHSITSLYESLLVFMGYLLFLLLRRKKVKQKEQELYHEALTKLEAIQGQLLLAAHAPRERIDYLKSIFSLLTFAVQDLKEDLEV